MTRRTRPAEWTAGYSRASQAARTPPASTVTLIAGKRRAERARCQARSSATSARTTRIERGRRRPRRRRGRPSHCCFVPPRNGTAHRADYRAMMRVASSGASLRLCDGRGHVARGRSSGGRFGGGGGTGGPERFARGSTAADDFAYPPMASADGLLGRTPGACLARRPEPEPAEPARSYTPGRATYWAPSKPAGRASHLDDRST